MDMADDDVGRLADESFSPTDDTDNTDFADCYCYADSTDDTDLSRLATPLRGMGSSLWMGSFFCARIERRISGWNIIQWDGINKR